MINQVYLCLAAVSCLSALKIKTGESNGLDVTGGSGSSGNTWAALHKGKTSQHPGQGDMFTTGGINSQRYNSLNNVAPQIGGYGSSYSRPSGGGWLHPENSNYYTYPQAPGSNPQYYTNHMMNYIEPKPKPCYEAISRPSHQRQPPYLAQSPDHNIFEAFNAWNQKVKTAIGQKSFFSLHHHQQELPRFQTPKPVAQASHSINYPQPVRVAQTWEAVPPSPAYG
ncbi:uncharacterized protein LOC136031993 [Artemia franciscana]|uniref:Uncharacterized protein n=1 Tax=Artemia franciscana TaxID=6661 RepID=A0AA88IEU9_ARTSF|nr:hypothetical protein QYM36_000441 [Artemia franciscana]